MSATRIREVCEAKAVVEQKTAEAIQCRKSLVDLKKKELQVKCVSRFLPEP